MYVNWQLLAPVISPGLPNPFAPFFFISGHLPNSPKDDPRYAKSYLDLLFIAYHIVFWSMVRQWLTINVSRPVARYFRIKKEAKINRFGEQTYALFYFFVFGAWGYVSFTCYLFFNYLKSRQRVMTQLPTYWYRTEYFWKGLRGASIFIWCLTVT